jgi:hypothetical protein
LKRLRPWLAVLTAGLLFTGASAQAPPTATSPSERVEPVEPDYRVSSEARVTSAQVIGTPFAKFLKYQNYEVTLDGGTTYTGGFVYGPGHHISAMAALVLDPNGIPYATFKTGDTRLSRALRNEPYVATSGIAGRWDKEGCSAGKIVLAELDEEVGGEVVDGTFRRLGDELSPTMPFESTECDEYFMAAVRITGKPYGDGGQMEVLDLIGPVFFSPVQAIQEMDAGRVSDAARARTMFGRAWNAIGYLPFLGVYVQDYPELLAGYDTLGLGPVVDLRVLANGGPIPAESPKASSLQARINTVVVDSSQTQDLGPSQHMVDARIQHAVRDEYGRTPLPPAFTSQYLKLDYDRAKVVLYYLDQTQSPMVEMATQGRPALAFAPGSPKGIRRDIRDIIVRREPVPKPSGPYLPGQSSGWSGFDTGPVDSAMNDLSKLLPGQPRTLAMHNAASSGQADLFYWYLSCQVDEPTSESVKHYVPLAEAIRLCRQGHGDAQTEATLLRLADHLGWVPELGMTRSKVMGIISNARPAGH